MSGEQRIFESPSLIDFISKVYLIHIPDNRKMSVFQNSATWIVDVFSAAYLYFDSRFDHGINIFSLRAFIIKKIIYLLNSSTQYNYSKNFNNSYPFRFSQQQYNILFNERSSPEEIKETVIQILATSVPLNDYLYYANELTIYELERFPDKIVYPRPSPFAGAPPPPSAPSLSAQLGPPPRGKSKLNATSPVFEPDFSSSSSSAAASAPLLTASVASPSAGQTLITGHSGPSSLSSAPSQGGPSFGAPQAAAFSAQFRGPSFAASQRAPPQLLPVGVSFTSQPIGPPAQAADYPLNTVVEYALKKTHLDTKFRGIINKIDTSNYTVKHSNGIISVVPKNLVTLASNVTLTLSPPPIPDPVLALSIIPNGLIVGTKIEYQVNGIRYVGQITKNGPNKTNGSNQVDYNGKNTTYKVEHLSNSEQKQNKKEVPRNPIYIKIVTKDLTISPPDFTKCEPLIKDLIIDLATLSKQINDLPIEPSADLLSKHAELKEIIKKIIN